MTHPIEIRRLTYADLPQVIAIERRAFTTPWSLAMFVLELSKPSGICLAAVEGDRIVGYLVCSRYDTVWHLMNVAVDHRLRRRGIAVALIERLFSLADRPGEQYTLEVRNSNRMAISLYERFGFSAAGRRRGYYHDNREDAVIMWRTVPEDAHGGASPARGAASPADAAPTARGAASPADAAPTARGAARPAGGVGQPPGGESSQAGATR